MSGRSVGTARPVTPFFIWQILPSASSYPRYQRDDGEQEDCFSPRAFLGKTVHPIRTGIDFPGWQAGADCELPAVPTSQHFSE